MPSKKPGQAPAFDATAHERVLYEELRKGDAFVVVGGQKITVQQSDDRYPVFADKSFPRWKRWVDGTAEYDGTGLRDIVNANAIMLDQVHDDLSAHKAADASRHATINQRLSALEAAGSANPFPASG